MCIAPAWPQGISLTTSQSTLLGTGASSKSNQRAQHGSSTCCNPRGTMSSRQPRLWKKTLTLNKHIYTHKKKKKADEPEAKFLYPGSSQQRQELGPWTFLAWEQGYPCQTDYTRTTVHAAHWVTRTKGEVLLVTSLSSLLSREKGVGPLEHIQHPSLRSLE